MTRVKQYLKASSQMLHTILKYPHGSAYLVLKIISYLLSTLHNVLLTVIPGKIINELAYHQVTERLILYILAGLSIPALISLIDKSIGIKTFSISKKIEQKINEDFYLHLSRIHYEQLEDPDIQDLKERATDAIVHQTVIVDQICAILSAAIGIVSVSYIMSRLSPIIILTTLLIVIANTLISVKNEKKSHDVVFDLTRKMRRQWGFTNTLDKIDYAKDIRLYDAGPLLVNKISQYQEGINSDAVRNTVIRHRGEIFGLLLNLLGQMITYGFVVKSVMENSILIGDVAIFISSTVTFTNFLKSIMSIYVEQEKNLLLMEDYNRFLSITLPEHKEGAKQPQLREDSVFIFHDVSFRYPSAERDAVSHLNLMLHARQHLCVVGENGAGKTTMIKLLTRLYDPTEGYITLDGEDIRNFDLKQYQELFSCVFQDSSRFYLTVRENITLSETCDEEQFRKACHKSGISDVIARMSKDADTQIGKWIDPEGIELSGGEAQSLSIARAIYHDRSTYILDEPTAALDPQAEVAVYRKFYQIIQEKTAVLITHRLSAVQLADAIAVFKDGMLAEYGTHNDLYRSGGLYRAMFDAQADFYRNPEDRRDQEDAGENDG